jgi:hypothetical protein
MPQRETSQPADKKLLDLEKYRLKLKLKDAGVEWHEDKSGKFKMWLRLAAPHTGL